MRLVQSVYINYYGLAEACKRFNEDMHDGGGAMFHDIAAAACRIDSRVGREKFLAGPFAAYAAALESGSPGDAHAYAKTIDEMASTGGATARAAMQCPVAPPLYRALRGTPAWDFFAANVDWCDIFAAAILASCTMENMDTLGDRILALQNHADVLRRFADELKESPESDNEDPVSSAAAILQTVSSFPEVFETMERAGASMLETLNVLANSQDAFDFSTPQGRSTAAEEIKLHYSRKGEACIWNLAASENGEGAILLYKRTPANAESVLREWGNVHVASILLDNFGDSQDMLFNATEAVAKYDEIALAILGRYKDNGDFRKFLANGECGWRIVPMMCAKGEAQALELLSDDVRFAKRFVDDNGFEKKEKLLLVEHMPLVGGIATVAKHWVAGEPCTMGELGWAAFDAADCVATIASLGASKVATEGAKQGVKQGARQLAKRTVVKRTIMQSGKIRKPVAVAKGSGEKVLRASSRRYSLDILERMGSAMRPARDSAVNTVEKVATAVKRQPVKWSARIAAASMTLFAVGERDTLAAIESTASSSAKQIGRTVGSVVPALAQGVMEGILSIPESAPVSTNVKAWFWLALGIVLAVWEICAIIKLSKRRRAAAALLAPAIAQLFCFCGCSPRYDLMTFEERLDAFGKLSLSAREEKMWGEVKSLQRRWEDMRGNVREFELDALAMDAVYVLNASVTESQRNELDSLLEQCADAQESFAVERTENALARNALDEAEKEISSYYGNPFYCRKDSTKIKAIENEIAAKRRIEAKRKIRLWNIDKQGMPQNELRGKLLDVGAYPFYNAAEREEATLAVQTVEMLMRDEPRKVVFRKAARLAEPMLSYLKVSIGGEDGESFHVDFNGDTAKVTEPQWNMETNIEWRISGTLPPPAIAVSWNCRNGGVYWKYASREIEPSLTAFLELLGTQKFSRVEERDKFAGEPFMEVSSPDFPNPEAALEALRKYISPGWYWFDDWQDAVHDHPYP